MVRKTIKAALSGETEKPGVAVDDFGSNADSIIEGMSFLQKMGVEYKTFIAKSVFTRIVADLKESKPIDAVFAVYLNCSIGNAERYKRGEK